MNELTIQPVSKVEADAGAQALRVLLSPSSAYQAGKLPSPAGTSADKSSEKGSPAGKPFSDVFLKFQLNQETNDVTVFVVDRASRQVVRTIPPDEITKLQAGDLVELLA